MGKPTYKTVEEANEALNEKKSQVKEAKSKLTSYYKENGLKRNEDYSKDKTHGKQIEKLETRITKRSNELEEINNVVKSFEPSTKSGKEKAAKKEKAVKEGKTKESKPKGGGGKLKYDYPDDIVTPDQKKKYRIEQRKLANGKTKDISVKKETTKKVKEEEVKEEPKTSTKKTSKANVQETKTSKKKVSPKKKSTKVEDDGDDD